jgi:hypothetical protein
LLRHYGEATSEFARRSSELTKAGRSYEQDIFQHLWDRAEDARRLCVSLRKELTHHLTTHPEISGLGAHSP